MENKLIIDHGWTKEEVLKACFTDEHRAEFERLYITALISYKGGGFGYHHRQRVPSDFSQLNIRFFDSDYQTIRTFIRPKRIETEQGSKLCLDLNKVHQRATEIIAKAEADRELRIARSERKAAESAERAGFEKRLSEAGFKDCYDLKLKDRGRLELTLRFSDFEDGLSKLWELRELGYLK